jgi:hypothetical protein
MAGQALQHMRWWSSASEKWSLDAPFTVVAMHLSIMFCCASITFQFGHFQNERYRNWQQHMLLWRGYLAIAKPLKSGFRTSVTKYILVSGSAANSITIVILPVFGTCILLPCLEVKKYIQPYYNGNTPRIHNRICNPVPSLSPPRCCLQHLERFELFKRL